MASNLDPGLVDPCIRMILEIQVLGPRARIGSVLLIYIKKATCNPCIILITLKTSETFFELLIMLESKFATVFSRLLCPYTTPKVSVPDHCAGLEVGVPFSAHPCLSVRVQAVGFMFRP